MENVVRKLEKIIEDSEAKPERAAYGPLVMAGTSTDASSPWISSSKVANAMQTLTSRIDDVELRTKLVELCKAVEADLGPQATDPASGVYNAARLLRFLYQTEMDVGEARTQTVLNFNARKECNMDAKRELIVSNDLSFDTLPRLAEYRKFQPANQFVGRAKDGRVISYINFGSQCDLEGLKKVFSVEEYVEGKFASASRSVSPSTALPFWVKAQFTSHGLPHRPPLCHSGTLQPGARSAVDRCSYLR